MDTENEIRTDTNAPEVIDFIRVDFSLLRTALLEHCQQWKRHVTRLLNDNARKELEELHSLMADASRTLAAPPANLEQLSRNIKLVKQIRKDKEAIEARFGPLEAMYATLAKFEVAVDEIELARLGNMRGSWEAFQTTLEGGEDAIKKSKAVMKKDLGGRGNCCHVTLVVVLCMCVCVCCSVVWLHLVQGTARQSNACLHYLHTI